MMEKLICFLMASVFLLSISCAPNSGESLKTEKKVLQVTANLLQEDYRKKISEFIETNFDDICNVQKINVQYRQGPSISYRPRIQKEGTSEYSLYDSNVFVVRSKSIKEIADSICGRALMAADNFKKQRGLKNALLKFYLSSPPKKIH